MKNLTQKQIEQIQGIESWMTIKFHGNRKYVGSLTVEQFREIVLKKREREAQNSYRLIEQPATKAMRLLKWSMETQGTAYFKCMIMGHTHIYYASPVHQHRDYNKVRLFPITERTLRIAQLFNSIVNN